MTDNSTLAKAILSMDSYNRGYNGGITFGSNSSDSAAVNGVTRIGNYTVYRSANTPEAKIIGFYAIAYQYEEAGVTKTVISYRGTDQFLTANGIGGGIINTQGAGADIATTAY